MKKRILAIGLSALFAFSLVGCGGSSDNKSSSASSTSSNAASSKSSTSEASSGSSSSGDIDYSSLKVGVIMKSSDEFQNQVVKGALDKCIELGIPESNFQNVASTSESDSAQQVTAVEDFIASGVDILLNACQEENALIDPLQKAADSGIKVVMVDTDNTLLEDKVTYIGTDNYAAAYEGAEIFAEDFLEEGDNVVILRGKLGDVNHEKRTQGLTDALEENGMNVLATQDANCETDKAAAAMEAFLSSYPDQIDAVMVTSDSMAVGAAQAIENAGASGIKICGFDGFQSAIDLVATGQIQMIIGQKPYQMGYEGVECGVGALSGETYDAYTNPGIQVINADNYKEFQD